MPVSAASATPGGKCPYSRRHVRVAIAAINTIAPSANPQIRVSGSRSSFERSRPNIQQVDPVVITVTPIVNDRPLGDDRFPRRGQRGGRHVARRGCDTRKLCNATALQIERRSAISCLARISQSRNAVAEVISDARGLSNRHLAKLPDGGLVELNPPGQVRDLPPRENRSGFRRGRGAPAPALQDRYPPDPRNAL
jgi:hypothetical protein